MADTAAAAAELDKATGQQQQEAAPRPVKRYRRAELDEEEERNKLLVPDDDDDDGWGAAANHVCCCSHAVCLPACGPTACRYEEYVPLKQRRAMQEARLQQLAAVSGYALPLNTAAAHAGCCGSPHSIAVRMLTPSTDNTCTPHASAHLLSSMHHQQTGWAAAQLSN